MIVLSLSRRCRKKKNADEDVDEVLERPRQLPDLVVLLAAGAPVEDVTGRARAATVAVVRGCPSCTKLTGASAPPPDKEPRGLKCIGRSPVGSSCCVATGSTVERLTQWSKYTFSNWEGKEFQTINTYKQISNNFK